MKKIEKPSCNISEKRICIKEETQFFSAPIDGPNLPS